MKPELYTNGAPPLSPADLVAACRNMRLGRRKKNREALEAAKPRTVADDFSTVEAAQELLEEAVAKLPQDVQAGFWDGLIAKHRLSENGGIPKMHRREPTPNSHWSEEEIEKLRQLYSAGVPHEELDAAFPGRSHCAIVAKAKAIGVKYRSALYPNTGNRWTEEEDRECLRLYLAGLKQTEIAGELGRSPASIGIRIARLTSDEPGKW